MTLPLGLHLWYPKKYEEVNKGYQKNPGPTGHWQRHPSRRALAPFRACGDRCLDRIITRQDHYPSARHSPPGRARAQGQDASAADRQARPEIARSLLAPAYSMASVIANEFSEASDPLYLSALIEIGLALFIVTIIVNALARILVWAVTRGAPVRGT